MRGFGHRLVAITAVLMACLSVLGTAGARAGHGGTHACSSSPRRPRSATGRSRRASQAVKELGAANSFAVDATEDAAAFTRREPRPLRRGRVDVDHRRRARRDAAGRVRALHPGRRRLRRRPRRERHRVHVELVRRPRRRVLQQPSREPQTATVEVADHAHPSTKHLPARWTRFGRVVQLPIQPARQGPRARHPGRDDLHARRPAMGTDHPIAWCQLLPGRPLLVHGHGPHRRVLPTRSSASTCSAASCGPPARQANDCGGTVWNNFQKVVLDDNVASPMGLDVAPDGRVIYIERAGQVRVIDPATAHDQDGDRPSRCTTRRRTACSASRWTRTSPPTAGSTSTTRRRRARSRHRAST